MKLISGLIATALGHGRMMEPPSRSSYRHLPDDPNIAPFWDVVVPNWQDNELFCGGFGVQVSQIRQSFIVNEYLRCKMGINAVSVVIIGEILDHAQMN